MTHKLLIALLTVMTCISAIAQSKSSIERVYNTFEDTENVLSLTLNKDIANLLDSELDWGDEMKQIEGDVTKISTLIVSEGPNSAKVLSKMKSMIDGMKFKHIDLPEGEDDIEDDIYVYAKGKKGKYSEVHMIIMDDKDDTGILLSVFGDITVKNAE